MISIDRIVCPLDFSTASRGAFHHAVALARRSGARVTALHVLPVAAEADARSGTPPAPGPSASPAVAGAAAALPTQGSVAAAMDGLAEPARRAGVRVDPVVVEGGTARRILEHANGQGVGLVVMGTGGAGGLERLIMGSVAEKIVREASCPVLTVSPDASPPTDATAAGTFERIVCAVDFSEASLKALEYAYTLADGATSEVAIVHVLETPDSVLLFPRRPRPTETDPQAILKAQTRLESLLPANVREVADPLLELRVGRPHQQILRFARERRAQVIVMGVQGRGRGIVKRLFLGSVTNKVVRGASCPVLSLRGGMPGASREDRAS
jgi:nucleotide-binding universal stress UspA family protein